MTQQSVGSSDASLLDRFRLDGRVAVITGASSGLGAGCAVGLAHAGADVVLGARRVDRLDDTRRAVESCGRRAVMATTDVTDVDDCRQLVEVGMRAFGRIDVLVNNAGIGIAVPALRETPEQFRSVVDVNLMGSYWMAQACAAQMRPGSSIVNVSSILGVTTAGLPQAAYAASKAAVLGLTRDLAQQWTGRRGIRVNAVVPGWFDAGMVGQYDAGYLDDVVRARVPLGRPGTVDECTAAILFLASDAASYVTGVALPVDGGVLIT